MNNSTKNLMLSILGTIATAAIGALFEATRERIQIAQITEEVVKQLQEVKNEN